MRERAEPTPMLTDRVSPEDLPLTVLAGAWLFGVSAISSGLAFMVLFCDKQSRYYGFLSLVLLLMGGKVVINGLRESFK